MFVVNIVDRFDRVNYGIWNAAINTSSVLKNKYKVKSFLYFPEKTFQPVDELPQDVELIGFKRNLSALPDPKETIVITHGCWQKPTRLANTLKKKGYKWIYVPHGMLEPWSMSQKSWIKYPYFWFIEKPMAKNADIIRAVSLPEKENLYKFFQNVIHIPNGNKSPLICPEKNWENKILFLFLGRLHKKKGILPLIEAWKKSLLYNHSLYQLIIAGTDDGLLKKVLSIIPPKSNINYIGSIFGEQKKQLLNKAHFFILPSYSEGFPTTIIEAMQHGVIPMISKGCNFSELLYQKLAIHVEPEVSNIINLLNRIPSFSEQYFNDLGKKNYEYAKQHYSIEVIAEMQYKMYVSLLNT